MRAVEDCSDGDESLLLVNVIAPFAKGIDLTEHQVGTIVRASHRVAAILIGEGWAIKVAGALNAPRATLLIDGWRSPDWRAAS